MNEREPQEQFNTDPAAPQGPFIVGHDEAGRHWLCRDEYDKAVSAMKAGYTIVLLPDNEREDDDCDCERVYIDDDLLFILDRDLLPLLE